MNEDDNYKYVYRRPIKLNGLEYVYAWDGGRYLFIWYGPDWDASEYFAGLKNMPERASEIVSEAFEYKYECVDIDSRRFPDYDSFKTYIDSFVDERGY